MESPECTPAASTCSCSRSSKRQRAVLGVQGNDGFLPVLGVAVSHFGTARFAFAILRVHLGDFHVEQRFHRPANIVLGRLATHLEGICIAARRAVHSLLGDQWLHDYLMWLQLKRPLPGRLRSFSGRGCHGN